MKHDVMTVEGDIAFLGSGEDELYDYLTSLVPRVCKSACPERFNKSSQTLEVSSGPSARQTCSSCRPSLFQPG